MNIKKLAVVGAIACISMGVNAADDEVLAAQTSEYSLTLIPKSYKFFNSGNGKILSIRGKFYGVSEVGYNLDVVFNVKASDCDSSGGDVLMEVENERPMIQKWNASGTTGFDSVGNILCMIDDKLKIKM